MTSSFTAGGLLRQARQRCGVSQAELARRAGTTQSVISVYESGRRQPSLQTLSSLVEAAGAHLSIKLAEPTAAPLHADVSRVRRVHANADRIRDAAERVGVTVLGVFGSVARGDDGPGSDIDLLIDVPSGVGLFAIGKLEAELRELLDAEVDLVPVAGLKSRVRRQVQAELLPL